MVGKRFDALNELLKEAGEVVFDLKSGHEMDVDQLMLRRNELQDKREANNREAATFPSGRHRGLPPSFLLEKRGMTMAILLHFGRGEERWG